MSDDNNTSDWSLVLRLAEQVENASRQADVTGDESAFEQAADLKADAINHLAEQSTPASEFLRELVEAGVDLTPERLRAVASLDDAGATH
jgi:hypothetical protein